MSPGRKGPGPDSPGSGPPPEGGGHLDRELLDAYVTGRRSVTDVLQAGLTHLAQRAQRARRARSPFDERTAGAGDRVAPEGAERLVRQVGRSLWTDPEEEARERSAARERVDALLRLDAFEALSTVRRERRFQNLGVAEILLDWTWYCLEFRALDLGRRGLELAHAVLGVIDPARYAERPRRRAEATLWLLASRIELADGDEPAALSNLEESTRIVMEGGGPGPGGWGELELGLGLAKAGPLLCHRNPHLDRLVLSQLTAEDLDLSPRATGRWASAFAANVAWLVRRHEGPERALVLIERLWDAGEVPQTLHVVTPSVGWAAREQLWCLAETGRVEAGMLRLGDWTEATDADGGPTRAERLQLAGSFWSRAGGPPELAGPPLEQAYRLFLTTRRGLDAALTAVELYRFYRGLGRKAAAVEAVAHLEEIACCRDVPGPALAALARFAHRAACATVAADDLDAMEDLLIATRAGWGPVRDENAEP